MERIRPARKGDIVVAVAVVGTLVGVWLWGGAPVQPPTVRFEGALDTTGSLPCDSGCLPSVAFEPIPANLTVHLLWVDETGGSVRVGYDVFIRSIGVSGWGDCGGAGPDGACRFSSLGGNYSFYASDSVVGQPTQHVLLWGSY